MATPYQVSLNKLKFIYDECGAELKKKKEQEKNKAEDDEFTILKKKIHEDIRNVRKSLKEREKLFVDNGNSSETAEASYRIRCTIKSIRESANKLKDIADKQEKKMNKKKNVSSDERTFMEKRKEIVSLVFQHIEEVERLEKKRFTDKASMERKQLLTKKESTGPAAGGMALLPSSIQETEKDPYMDSNLDDFNIDEDLMLIQRNNEEIDQELDEISEGLKVVKQIAIGINDELDKQEVIIDRIEENVDRGAEHLQTLNTKLDNIIEKGMKGDRFLLNSIIAIIIITVIGFIVIKFIS